MKIMRKPLANSILITVISAFYSAVFALCSGHLEFERLLHHSGAQNTAFWNGWSAFLKQGNLKYIGYAYAVITAVIVLLSLARKHDYDEYQAGFLEKGAAASGVAMLLLFPLAFLLILSDPGCAVQTVTFLVVAHWSVLLVSDLIYVIKWSRA